MVKPPKPKPLPSTPTPASFLSSSPTQSSGPVGRNLAALRNTARTAKPSLLGGA